LRSCSLNVLRYSYWIGISTARPHDRTTARLHDCMTVRLQDNLVHCQVLMKWPAWTIWKW